MPMHCSANVGPAGDTAVFFGLSGTGKTTLSADPTRTLIGDDEHGWGGGRRLQFRRRLLCQDDPPVAEAEPEIYATTERFGTVLENVMFDPRPAARFRRWLADREHPLAYPLHFIPNSSRPAWPAIPRTSSC
jgi:phosphoenolpyruvate carboxykinase (ATP)